MPAQVSILQHILGISTRAEHAVGDTEQPRAMALEFARTILHDFETLECRFLTIDGCGCPPVTGWLKKA
jgi:hypothetical protein